MSESADTLNLAGEPVAADDLRPSRPARKSASKIWLGSFAAAILTVSAALYVQDVFGSRTGLFAFNPLVFLAPTGVVLGLNVLYWAAEQGRYSGWSAGKVMVAVIVRLSILAPVSVLVFIGLVAVDAVVLIITGVTSGFGAGGEAGPGSGVLGLLSGQITAPGAVTIPDGFDVSDLLGSTPTEDVPSVEDLVKTLQ
ncbi:hypothetical protein [Leifsonia sp. Leaf264]|uniref:hypothetical protein n=1 Tax=Leifsonia sp. Leaf264 TaxID=1736314 RepID=UPI0012FABD25|nr:hypothetical protein [Leifsonia sp. Leaf264]